jgi:hypothetical protein
MMCSWRHVGLFKAKGKLACVLFDVAYTSEVIDPTEAIAKMKNALQAN